MTVEMISQSIYIKVLHQAGIKLLTPGSTVRCATGPGAFDQGLHCLLTEGSMNISIK